MNLLNERGTRWENHDYVMRGALPQPLALETEHGDAMLIVHDIASNVKFQVVQLRPSRREPFCGMKAERL